MLVKSAKIVTNFCSPSDEPLQCSTKPHSKINYTQYHIDDDTLIREMEFIGFSLNETAKTKFLVNHQIVSPENHFLVFAFCFGSFDVYRMENIDRAVGFRTTKAKELLAYFFHHRHHFISRQEIITDLWPEMDPEQASDLLHTNLYYVRNTLKSGNIKHDIIYGRGGYRMDLSEITSDVIIFEDLIKKISSASSDTSIQLLEQAVSIYRGEYYQNMDWDWALARREQYQQIYLSILKKLAAFYTEAHHFQRAALYLRRVLEVNPLLEETHAQLMRVYASQGDRRAVMNQYEVLCKVLAEELGIEPESQVKKLYYQLLQ